MVQQVSYAQEIKELEEKQEVTVNSALKTQHPFIDNEGLIRVGGRLQQSTLPYQIRHQMILPANHHFSNLNVSGEHFGFVHGCPRLLNACLWGKY